MFNISTECIMYLHDDHLEIKLVVLYCIVLYCIVLYMVRVSLGFGSELGLGLGLG